MTAAADAGDGGVIGTVTGATAPEDERKTGPVDIDLCLARTSPEGIVPIDPRLDAGGLPRIVRAGGNLGEGRAGAKIHGRDSRDTGTCCGSAFEDQPTVSIGEVEAAVGSAVRFEEPQVKGVVRIRRAGDDLAGEGAAEQSDARPGGCAGRRATGDAADASTARRAVAAGGIDRVDVGDHRACRGVVEVPLQAHLIGVESRGAIQREIPADGDIGAVARRFAAGAATCRHLDLRVDAGAIDPFKDHPLRPARKPIDRLPHRKRRRRCQEKQTKT